MGDQNESRLIELMVCAAKQTATGEPPVGRIMAKKQPNAKDQRLMLDDRTRLTEQFIPVIPALLQKVANIVFGM
jgi:cohesin complex subunit SA-1/2